MNALRALAPPPLRPVPRPSRPQPRTPTPRWSRRHSWHHICSFVGPCGIEKDDFLRQLRQYIPGHDYVMVGNVLGLSGASDDRGAAERAGSRFIKESEFAKGVR
jgi:hypothetical protein